MIDLSKTKVLCLDCRFVCKASGSVACPRCGKLMLSMGKAFRPPKKGNKRQWKKIELMLGHGQGFFGSCQCWYCKQNKPPATYSDAKNLYGQRRNRKK